LLVAFELVAGARPRMPTPEETLGPEVRATAAAAVPRAGKEPAASATIGASIERI
jgi:hypothetical protein